MIAALPLVLVGVLAADTTKDSLSQDSLQAEIAKFEAKLEWKTGAISIQDGLATLNLPAGYRYLGPEDASSVLEAWGNPPDSKTLGMLFPADMGPFSEGSWAVVITYDEDGYVKDDEAAKINYTKLLGEMRESIAAENKARKKDGFEPIQLVGWAAPPHYDSTSHKLYWAKELQFGDGESHTLNYNIRALGRRGVLVLNAVAGMSELSQVETGMKDVLGFVAFNEGHRYTDFVPGKDKVAAYGIGALIVGSVAAKAGLFKGLIALIVAGKKILVAGVIAAAAGIRKFLNRDKGVTPTTNA